MTDLNDTKNRFLSIPIMTEDIDINDLVTPYFRKSVSYVKSRSEDEIEKKVNEYLDSQGIHFVEAGQEAVLLARKNNSIQSAEERINKHTSLSEIAVIEPRRSTLSLDNNNLFLRRKISSQRNTPDTQ